MEATGSEIICGAPTTLAVNGQMRCENLEKGHGEVGGGGGEEAKPQFPACLRLVSYESNARRCEQCLTHTVFSAIR